MKKQLFHVASLKLAATYLVVLMVLSSVFSVAIYQLSSAEFDRNYDRANEFADRFVGFRFEPGARETYLHDRETERASGKARIINQLLFFNVVILAAGGGVCYFLARRTLEPIEAAHVSLERFTSDAAHELRTPLATMRTEIEVALLRPKLSSAEANDLLRSNLEEVDRLTELSDRLLGLARGDSGALVKEPVVLTEILQKAVDTVATGAKKKDILVEIKMASIKTKVVGDQASLTEVFIILLDNAIKYSPKTSSVQVAVSQSHGAAQIKVIDTGIGIAPKDIDHIFKRFYRADASRTKDVAHGYGLGLPLAKKIIQEHGGSISVKSSQGKGSTITVTLPQA